VETWYKGREPVSRNINLLYPPEAQGMVDGGVVIGPQLRHTLGCMLAVPRKIDEANQDKAEVDVDEDEDDNDDDEEDEDQIDSFLEQYNQSRNAVLVVDSQLPPASQQERREFLVHFISILPPEGRRRRRLRSVGEGIPLYPMPSRHLPGSTECTTEETGLRPPRYETHPR
jgi:hypothetical protein